MRIMRTPFILLAFALVASSSAFPSERYTIGGFVRDASSGDGLAAANVRVLGIARGTITNLDGQYALTLDGGRYQLIFSSLGYRPDTLTVDLTTNLNRDVALTQADITLPEIVVTAEDPAIEIIRRAIANKHRWIDRLLSYELDAFNRQMIERDTGIASITESYTRGYWRQGDTLREIMTQRRQTSNIPAGFNFASVGRILNFNDDEIRFAGYTFTGPTAPNALDYYDYRLFRTFTFHGREAYEIRMIPRSRTSPLFDGTITIAGESYALAGIDVKPNEAFQLPFVKEKSLRYRQQFGLYDSLFWMPADIRIDASITVGILGFSIPRIGFHQTSVITDYSINTAIPDSLFGKPRLVIDSAATRVDSAFWATHTVLPLDPREREAYRTLDSTKTLDVQFRPSGMAMTIGLGDNSSNALSALSWIDFGFNRVEGLHLGVQKTFDSLVTHTSLRGGIAYGFTLKRTAYRAGLTVYPAPSRSFGIGADVYRVVGNVPDQEYYGSAFVGIGALLSKVDYRDYFSAQGWSLFVTADPWTHSSLRLGYTAEGQGTEAKRTDFSLFYPSRLYRDNPAITDGMLRSLQGWLRIGPEPIPFGLVAQNSFEAAVEYASPSVLAGDFRFTRLLGILSLTFPTFSQSYLFPQALRVRISAGTSTGDLPPQRLFGVETSLSSFAPFGVQRAGTARELTGTRLVSFSIEHNFRSVPFLLLGIPFLYENNIELILHGGAARVWGAPAGAPPSAQRWYTEAGVSINRLFELFRTDFTWRLSHPTDFVFTLGVAHIL
jgi:hypothetical protein